MKKSLFIRMLLVYLLIIFMSLTLLGGIFYGNLRNQFLYGQMDIMIENAQEINEWATENYYARMTDAEFQGRLLQKAEAEHTVVWLVSGLEKVYMIADPEGKSAVDETFSSQSLRKFCDAASEGNYARYISDVDHSFKNQVMSVAIPLTVEDTIVGTIVVHREMKDMDTGMGALSGQVVFPVLVAVAFAFVLVFFLSRYIVKPIREISYAAGELSRGNYDWRVQPRTHDEIGELAQSFNKMAEDIKLQDSLRNTFIANVSHELRTPLASTQGFIQGMLDHAIDEADRDKYLEIVLGETKRMNVLISDLLSLAKLESGQFPIELSEFDINELVRRCIIMFEQRIEDKNLEVNIQLSEEKMMVWADEDRISQVVTNLVDNAVKFSEESGELKIWTDSVGDKVYVNIADTGEGIPAEEQAYIFERFYKVDKSHSRNKPGTGIGLSLVKRIITQHGEKISVQSEPGKGAAFTFTLSKAAETEPEEF